MCLLGLLISLKERALVCLGHYNKVYLTKGLLNHIIYFQQSAESRHWKLGCWHAGAPVRAICQVSCGHHLILS